jgi:predicted AAA+ superfamily ATPase
MDPNPYRLRIVDTELDELMRALPALAIEGAKGVGKTATAARRSRTIRRFDDSAQLEIASADPRRVLDGDPPVLLDEWQRIPPVWDAVRRAVDDGALPGRFLLTGSAIPRELPAHSGAGRIAALRMRPMTLSERGVEPPTVSLARLLGGQRPPLSGSSALSLDHYAEEIVASGLPGLRALSGRARRSQLDSYLVRVAERDFAEVGVVVRRPQTLRRWMQAYAAATATTTSYDKIRDAATSGKGATPARSTTLPYRDALERLFLLDPVPAWLPTRNQIARLASPPKHHLADPAFAARLLGVDVTGLLDGAAGGPPIVRDGTLLGALFESLVTLCVRVYAQQSEAQVRHLRTRAGEREVDLIVELADGRVLAIETKLARTVSDRDTRHLHWLAGQIGSDLIDAIVVTTGSEAYRRTDGIGVVPAALLGP